MDLSGLTITELRTTIEMKRHRIRRLKREWRPIAAKEKSMRTTIERLQLAAEQYELELKDRWLVRA